MADLTGRDADETKPDIATWGTGNVLETGEGTVKVDLDGKADSVSVAATINVPSDFSTLQQAFDSVKSVYTGTGDQIVINIESGHSIKTGTLTASDGRKAALYAYNGNYNHIRITSTDAVVPVETGFDGSVIIGEHCQNVVLDCLIDMDGEANGLDGYVTAWAGSGGKVLSGAGVINCTRIGLYSRSGADMKAVGGVVFTGAGWRGAYCNHTSRMYIRNGDFSGLKDWGHHTPDAGIVAQHGSTIDAQAADASNSAGDGVRAQNCSTINIPQGIANDCAEYGFYADDASTIYAGSGTADGCKKGAYIRNSSQFHFPSGSAKNCNEYGVHAERLSNISMRIGDVSDGDTGIFADEMSKIYAIGITATGCTSPAIRAENGSEINADDAVATGVSAGAGVVYCINSVIKCSNADLSGNITGPAIQVISGGEVIAQGSDLSDANNQACACRDGSEANIIDAQTSGHGATNGILAQDGSIIRAKGTTAPTTIDVNTLSADGIIFR